MTVRTIHDSIELTPRFRSEVKLGKDALLSGDHAREIRDLLVERGALVFRNLHLDDDELHAVACTLGDLRKRGSDGTPWAKATWYKQARKEIRPGPETGRVTAA